MAADVLTFEDDELLAAERDAHRRERYAPARWTLSKLTFWFVALAPITASIPMALNRPTLWLLAGVLIALLTLASAAFNYGPETGPLAPMLDHPWLFAVALLIPFWGCLQAIPSQGMQSILPSASLAGSLRFLSYILFALLALSVLRHRRQTRRLSWVLFLCVVAQAIWALVALNVLGDIHFWGPKSAYLGSATGTFINRNALAMFLGMGGCVGMSLVLTQIDGPSTNAKAVGIAASCMALALVFAALLATQSRLGVLAAGIGMLIPLAHHARRWTSRRRWAGLCLLLLAGMWIFGQLGDGVLARLVDLRSHLEIRLFAYQLSLELIAQRPLVGHGFDSFRAAFETVHRPPLPAEYYWDRAHSTYLTHWVELGLLVGSAPLVLGGLALRGLLRTQRLGGKGSDLAVGSISALIVAAVHSLGDFGLEMPVNVFLLIAIVAVGMTCQISRSTP